MQAIYSFIELALLEYDLYANTLKKMGFTSNEYDRCVANKVINGKQCTLTWYVDDNKLLYEDPAVVTDILNVLKGYFSDLVIIRGYEHVFWV